MLYYKLLVLILLSLLLTGCSTKFTEGEFLDLKYKGMQIGKTMCREKSMDYIGNEFLDLNTQTVHCALRSPVKIYSYNVEVN